MTKNLLLTAVCVFAFSGAVLAQENTITIIHDDGSQDVIELGGSASKPMPEKVVPKVEVSPEPSRSVIFKKQEPVADPAMSAVPVTPRAERVVEPVAVQEEKVEAVSPPKAEVKPKPKPKKKAKPKTVKKKVSPKKDSVDVLAFIPPRKPYRRAVPTSDVISKDRALYIALSEAPPARDVQVYPREGASGLEYSVIFKTEDGAYEVVVDGASGVVKSSGAIKNGQALVRPGHLPSR